MRNFKLFIPLIIFVVLAIFLLKGLERDPTELPSALVGESVPSFELPHLLEPGQEVSEEIFQGHVSLLNVWGTWCPSCRTEHPFLVKLADEGVRIIGMDYKDDDALARRWLEDLGNPYAITFADATGSFGIDLGVYGAPETYIIDRKGIIRAKRVGVVDARIWQGEFGDTYRRLLAQEAVQ